MKSEVTFADDKLQKEFEQLDKINEGKFKQQLLKAFENLKEDAFCGIQLPKRLIPEEYKRKYPNITNLWKYNLPDAWRLIYTVKDSKISVLSVVLEWLDHKNYERRFNY